MANIISTKNSSVPSIQTGATALAANNARIGWSIQNLSTNPLFVCQGDGASTTVFHHVLKGGTAPDDGLGGSLVFMDGAVFSGNVTVAGTGLRYVALEIAP